MRAKVPNLDDAGFAQDRRRGRKNCPVSKVLNATITLGRQIDLIQHRERCQPRQVKLDKDRPQDLPAIISRMKTDSRAILPEDIDWNPFPAFPPGARLAVLVGHPTEPGSYVVRVKVPGGTKLMPHKHPEDRIYTVMSGVFYIGLGETSMAIR